MISGERVTIILNAAAGTGGTHANAAAIGDALTAAGLEPTVITAQGPGIGAAARRAVSDGVGIVAAGGGDGTISAVASVVAGTGAALGVLPLGTLNHFAKDLRIPLDLPAAVITLATGQPTMVDVGEVNGHLFINNSSIGAYPRLVWEREQQQRQGRRKALAMSVAILRVWRRYRRVGVDIQHEGRRRIVRTPFVFVGNNEYQLDGVRRGGRPHLDRGCLHLCMAPGLKRYEVAGVLLAALVGNLRDVDRFESIRTTAFSIEARRREIGVSLDGEVTLLRTPLHFRIRPRLLRVLVPAGAPQEAP